MAVTNVIVRIRYECFLVYIHMHRTCVLKSLVGFQAKVSADFIFLSSLNGILKNESSVVGSCYHRDQTISLWGWGAVDLEP